MGKKVSGKPYIPPSCPKCGSPLKTVLENVYETYHFDEKTGTYREDEYRGELKAFCSHCEGDVADLFEDGPCNYQATRQAS